jgi:hypothetical protein
MSRFIVPLVLACLLAPSLALSAGSETGPRANLSPAMQRMLEDEPGRYRVWVFLADKGLTDLAARREALAEIAASYNRKAVERRGSWIVLLWNADTRKRSLSTTAPNSPAKRWMCGRTKAMSSCTSSSRANRIRTLSSRASTADSATSA